MTELDLRLRKTHFSAKGGPKGQFILCGAAGVTTNQTVVWALVTCQDCIDRDTAADIINGRSAA